MSDTENRLTELERIALDLRGRIEALERLFLEKKESEAMPTGQAFQELKKSVQVLEGLLLARIGVSEREQQIRTEAQEARRQADLERMKNIQMEGRGKKTRT